MNFIALFFAIVSLISQAEGQRFQIQRPLNTNPYCPSPDGDFANPSSEQCTTFYRCARGSPSILRCPDSQRFDFVFRFCRPQAQVNCNQQLQIFSYPVIANGLGGRPGIVPGLGNVGGLGGLAGGLGGGLPAGLVGGLGGLGGTGGLGGGLLNGGLISLLANANGGGQDGDGADGADGGNNNNNNNLALFAALGSLLTPRASQRRIVPQVQTAPLLPFNPVPASYTIQSDDRADQQAPSQLSSLWSQLTQSQGQSQPQLAPLTDLTGRSDLADFLDAVEETSNLLNQNAEDSSKARK